MRSVFGWVPVLMLAVTGVWAQDSLLAVAPLRVILKDNHPSDILSITNKSGEIHHYLITVKNEVMGPDGTTSEKTDFAYSAKRMLRFTPKEITLKPGEYQNVRVMAMVPEGTPEGEYHSHIIFDEKLIPTESETKIISTFQAALKNQYSVGIPVIIQHGDVKGDLTLEGAQVIEKNGQPILQATLIHTGNAEAQGFLTVTAHGISSSLVQPRHIWGYRETDKMVLSMPITNPSTTLQMLKAEAPNVNLAKSGRTETKPVGF